jgi:hypothetical protein
VGDVVGLTVGLVVGSSKSETYSLYAPHKHAPSVRVPNISKAEQPSAQSSEPKLVPSWCTCAKTRSSTSS